MLNPTTLTGELMVKRFDDMMTTGLRARSAQEGKTMTLDMLLKHLHLVLDGGDDLFQHKIEIKTVRLSDQVAVPLKGKLIDLVPRDKVGDSSFTQVIAVDYSDRSTDQEHTSWALWDGNLDESGTEQLVLDLVEAIEEDTQEFDEYGGYDDDY